MGIIGEEAASGIPEVAESQSKLTFSTMKKKSIKLITPRKKKKKVECSELMMEVDGDEGNDKDIDDY